METQNIFSYISTEETGWKTARIPVTDNKDWNMYQHIQRCKNVANAWYHAGIDDGNRPYDDLVTPIINVAFRTEGFDVKDIVPYVNDSNNYYKSFLVKKFHPRWARIHELDTLIDKMVEYSVIYDLVLLKNVNNKPEVIPLESIAFCDQTDVLSAPICLKHQYSISDLLEFKGKWNDEAIDEAILLARKERGTNNQSKRKGKSPGKYIEVYELRGMLPDSWLNEDGDPEKYVDQLQITTLDKSTDGTGLILFKGKSKPITEVFDALKIDQVRSYGRACGRSIVESLFEPQVWNNYSAIKIKKMLDSAINIFQTDSEEYGNQKLTQLPDNTILKHETGKPITKVNTGIENMDKFMAHKQDMKESARILGSASEGALGINPASGTPFKLQELITQQGQGIHEYRQGKIATFFGDRIYKNWILPAMVKDMNAGERWLDDLSLEEMQYVAEGVGVKQANRRAVKLVLEKKPEDEISQEDIEDYRDMVKQEFMKGGNKRFLEIIKDELKDLPIDVYVNIAGKQKNMPQEADKLTNIIREVIRNPQAFAQMPGLTKAINSLFENSGLNPIDFTQITTNQPQPQAQPQQVAQSMATGQ